MLSLIKSSSLTSVDFDWATGLYYLQSRYYDPALRRFISADVYMDTGQVPLGTNMYMYCLNDPINYIDPDGFMGRPNNAPFGPLSRADWLAQNAGLIDQVRQWAMAANRYDPEQFLNTINFRITNDHGTHQDVTATFMHNNDSHEVDFIMGTAQELLNYSASRMRNEITPSTRRSGLQDLGGALLDIIPGVAFFRTLATVGGIQQDSRSLGTHIYDIASPIVARGQSNRQIFIMTQSRRNGQVRWPDWNSNTNRAWY